MKSLRLLALLPAVLMALPLAHGSASAASGTTTTAAAATAPYSAIATRDADGAGYYIAPEAPAAVWEAPATTITLTEPGAGLLTLTAGSTTTARLSTFGGSALALGTFPIKPAETLTPGTLKVDLKSGALDNDFASGTVTVRELTRDTSGAITALAADIVGSYAGHDSWTQGTRTMSLRYRSALGYTAVQSTDNAYVGSSSLGTATAPTTLTMTVRGTTPVRFGAAYGDMDPGPGVDPGPLEIVSDGCVGRQVAPGQSCSVSVQVVPVSTEQLHGLFVIPDDSGRTSFATAAWGTIDPSGRYAAVTPTRLYDSRTSKAFAAGETRRIRVAGRAGIPTGSGFSVVLSITAVTPGADGHLSAFHQIRPATSHLNYRKGVTRANLATSVVWQDGTVAVYSSAASHVLVDVLGYFDPQTTAGSQLEPVDPTRILDTRRDAAGALGPGEIVDVALDFGPEISPDVTGVVVNLTAVGPQQPGHVTAWAGDTAPPTVSSLNFRPGATVPVLAFVPTSQLEDGSVAFALRNGSSGSTHLLADIVGYFDEAAIEGLRFFPTGGERLLDTRTGQGLTGAFGARQSRDVRLGSPWYKHTDTVGLQLNLVAVNPSASTYLTVWDRQPGEAPPLVSTLNAVRGDSVANAAITGLTATDTFGIYNNAGTTHVIADVFGTWDLYPGSQGAGPFTPSARSASERTRDPVAPRVSTTNRR